MKALAGVSIPDEFALEFGRLLRWFDESHPDSTIQVISDAALPVSADQLRATCAPHASD